VPQSLRTWLANVELSTDGTDRGNPIYRKLLSEYLGRLHLQRVRIPSSLGHIVRQYLRTADYHHEEFVRTDQRDRRPCRYCRTDQAVPEAVCDIGRKRCRDA
jgi:hypothetical protein